MLTDAMTIPSLYTLALAHKIRSAISTKPSAPRLLAMKAGVAAIAPSKSRTLATPQA
jgi:hypothetical protein